MATTAINFRMDAALKASGEKRIPFEINADPFYSEENVAHIKKSAEELRVGKGTVHELIED